MTTRIMQMKRSLTYKLVVRELLALDILNGPFGLGRRKGEWRGIEQSWLNMTKFWANFTLLSLLPIPPTQSKWTLRVKYKETKFRYKHDWSLGLQPPKQEDDIQPSQSCIAHNGTHVIFLLIVGTQGSKHVKTKSFPKKEKMQIQITHGRW